MTVSVRRLPYSRVACPPARSTVSMMDSAGVMPDPATTKPWCPVTSSGVNLPSGGRTSSVSPGASRSTMRAENNPFSTRRTPMRGAAPSGAQME
jgi:hypothetical protein